MEIVPEPMGTAYKALLPYQTFRTKTKDLALAVGSDRLWRIFCPIMGLEAMMDDPRFATNAARVQYRTELIARLQEVFLTRPYEEWEALLLEHGIPVGAINTIDQVVEHPQVKSRGMIVESEHPVAGKVKLVGIPVKLSETPGSIREPAPLLGQHTEEVLQTYLHMSQDRDCRAASGRCHRQAENARAGPGMRPGFMRCLRSIFPATACCDSSTWCSIITAHWPVTGDFLTASGTDSRR